MGTKQYLIDSINADVAKAGNLKLEDYEKKALEKYATDRETEKSTINSAYDKAKENAQATSDKATTDINADYESQYQKNAVQKLINEKQIAERNANLGLTDSGLNRTQQTATQLSYANQKGKIDLARQSALDNLTLNLTSALTEIESNRNIDLLNSDQKWNDKAYLEGQTNYNNDLTAINNRITSAYEQYGDILQAEADAAAQVQKAAIEAKADDKLLLWRPTGTYDDSGNQIFININGKTQAFGDGVSPYTGKMHDDAKTKGKYDSSKVFSNGYQPNNIGGKKLVAQTEYEVYVNNNKQKVWSYDDGKTLWAWDGSINDYVNVTSKREELEKNNGGN